jgi:aromatic ring-cleaving dioxygenase
MCPKKVREPDTMSMPANLYGYHVHIYFDDRTKARATVLHDTLVEQFKAQPSRPHPLTDDEVEDHTTHAVWFGTPVELLMDKLKHGPTISELKAQGLVVGTFLGYLRPRRAA